MNCGCCGLIVVKTIVHLTDMDSLSRYASHGSTIGYGILYKCSWMSN